MPQLTLLSLSHRTMSGGFRTFPPPLEVDLGCGMGISQWPSGIDGWLDLGWVAGGCLINDAGSKPEFWVYVRYVGTEGGHFLPQASEASCFPRYFVRVQGKLYLAYLAPTCMVRFIEARHDECLRYLRWVRFVDT